MATYFERMRAGMQMVQELLADLEPGAMFEWGPMDNAAFYPFYLVRGGRRVLLTKFSKDSLVAMCDEPYQAKVRAGLRQALVSGQQAVR
jgi:hypothetical protein